MKSLNKIVILSLPRCGSSLLTNLISSAGYNVYTSENSELLKGSAFNPKGYFEDKTVTLLNDQIIRCVFGHEYSFLYMPNLDQIKSKFEFKTIHPSDYSYDLDNDSVFFPENFIQKIKEYTGAEYDIWGLTRMIDDGKWNKCYSINRVKTYDEIVKKIDEISNDFNYKKENTVLKDPRLNLTLPFFKFSDKTKFVFLTREKQECLSSMRRHYGKWLFTNNYLPNTDICSNYFNYKIKYQDFDYYYKTYNDSIDFILKDKNHIKITYQDILDKNISELENFIEAKIDTSLINT